MPRCRRTWPTDCTWKLAIEFCGPLLLSPLLPPGLLSQADEGANSRDRIYSLRRTFFGFLYQVLKPDCPSSCGGTLMRCNLMCPQG